MSNEKYPTWQKLMDSVFAKQLTSREEEARVLANLNYQVQNGGFSQWVWNGYLKDDGKELRRVLNVMGTENANAVRKMVCEVQRDAAEYDDDYDFNALDEAYYTINDAFMMDVELFLSRS